MRVWSRNEQVPGEEYAPERFQTSLSLPLGARKTAGSQTAGRL